MILSSAQIAKRLKEGEEPGASDPLVIAPPPDLAELTKQGFASVDLRLGTWFLSLRQARMAYIPVETSPQQLQFTKTHYVPFGKEYYLHPRNFVLGISLEWLRLPANLAGYVVGKSSWGRRGLIIATATGVHPGFKGCITLELTNIGEIPIGILPGMPICQLFLHHVELSGMEVPDRSQFVGSRKPKVGRIVLDPLFKKLAKAYEDQTSGQLSDPSVAPAQP